MGSRTAKKTRTAKSNFSATQGKRPCTRAIARGTVNDRSDSYNADGVVEAPSIAIHRERSERDLIAATLYCHQVAGYWISSAVWKLSVSPLLGDGAYLIDGKVRGLTPREACRMQGLPEWFEHDPDTRRALKQAGNALAYPLFRALGTQIADALKPRS